MLKKRMSVMMFCDSLSNAARHIMVLNRHCTHLTSQMAVLSLDCFELLGSMPSPENNQTSHIFNYTVQTHASYAKFYVCERE